MSSNYLLSLYREWEMLLDSLSNGLVDNFTNIHDEYNAVCRIYKTSGIREIFTRWLSNLNANDSNNIVLEKSSKLADKWREKGNDFFKIGNLSNSLKYYNLSVLSAPRNHVTFPLALANRSAVLVRMSKYKEALCDVQLALENGYPTDKIQKLEERKQKCNDSLIRDVDVVKQLSDLNINHEIIEFDQFETAYDCLSKILLPNKHSTLEGASRNIDLKYSVECGRYIVTRENVKRGEVLYVEKPYAFVALPGPNGVLPIVCEYCCQPNPYPIPCAHCAGSIYCSEECRKEAWDAFHVWECNGTSKLLWQAIGIAHLALRVLLIASGENFGLKSNVLLNNTAQQILEEINRVSKTSNAVSGYHRVYNLVTNFDKMAAKDLLQYTLTSVMLTMYLKHHTNFIQSVEKTLGGNNDAAEIVVCSLLLRQLGQMVSSGHALCGIGEGNGGEELRQTRLATGIFPSASMMNHSCDSNIINNHRGSVLVVRASRDIPSGDEVFNCYGPSYKTMKGEERRTLLKGQYLFDCHCTACSSREKDNFVDVFNAFKCSNCSHSVVLDSEKKIRKCEKCGHKIQYKKVQRLVDESLELFQNAAERKGSNAITTLLAVQRLQNECLTKYNTHLQKTMDSLARNYAFEGSFEQSISLINQLISVVKYQYGENSVEVGHELQKLCDVMMMELEGISDKTSSMYRALVAELKTINKNVLDIFYYAYGCWTHIYKDVKDRQLHLASLL